MWEGQVRLHLAAFGRIAWVSRRRWTGTGRPSLTLEPVPFSSRALILGVGGGAGGHVSLISSVVRVCWLAAFPRVEQSGEDAVKMAPRGVCSC